MWSAPYPLSVGRTVRELGIPDRLERLGYERVRALPTRPGSFFWGEEVFWIYRRAHRWDGRDWPDLLVGLTLEREGGRVRSVISARRRPVAAGEDGAWLEPEVLAESLDGRRAPRLRLELADLPEPVWRSVLAA